VPDIVVTLAMSFVWGGVALLILPRPGGGAPDAFMEIASGNLFTPWLPNGLILLVAWLRSYGFRSRWVASASLFYAVGSDLGPPHSAERSGSDRRALLVRARRIFAACRGSR